MAAIDTIMGSAVDAVKKSGALEAGAIMGTVSTVNAAGTVTVTRGADTYPNVRLLAGDATPAVGALVEILKTSGGWVCLGSLVMAKPPAGTILDTRTGRTFLTPVTANTPVSVGVVFSPPLRAGAEVIVMANVQTVSPLNVGTGFANNTVNGFTLYLERTDTTGSWVHWTASSIS